MAKGLCVFPSSPQGTLQKVKMCFEVLVGRVTGSKVKAQINNHKGLLNNTNVNKLKHFNVRPNIYRQCLRAFTSSVSMMFHILFTDTI